MIQCCVGFYCPITQISHNYTHNLLLSLLLPSPTPPLWVISEHQAGLPGLYSTFSAIHSTCGSVKTSRLLSLFSPLSAFPLCPQSLFHIWPPRFPGNRFVCTVFSSLHASTQQMVHLWPPVNMRVSQASFTVFFDYLDHTF